MKNDLLIFLNVFFYVFKDVGKWLIWNQDLCQEEDVPMDKLLKWSRESYSFVKRIKSKSLIVVNFFSTKLSSFKSSTLSKIFRRNPSTL